jgi:hypothetical protein
MILVEGREAPDQNGGEQVKELKLGPPRWGTDPRTVRNFWVDVNIDGLANGFTSGPKGKDGGFEAVIFMRGPDGDVRPALTLLGTATSDGKAIQLTVLDGMGDRVITTGLSGTGR